MTKLNQREWHVTLDTNTDMW